MEIAVFRLRGVIREPWGQKSPQFPDVRINTSAESEGFRVHHSFVSWGVSPWRTYTNPQEEYSRNSRRGRRAERPKITENKFKAFLREIGFPFKDKKQMKDFEWFETLRDIIELGVINKPENPGYSNLVVYKE